MKMSKKEGLEMLRMLDVPTVEVIDANLLDENSHILKEGLSVRTSPKSDTQNNVYLPSIHNCRDLNEIREFIREHQRDYYIIVHKTVKPELLGSISKYQLSPENENLVIELFKNFEERKKEIIKNRAILPVVGERIMASELQIKEKDKEDFCVFSKVIQGVRKMPFKTYDAEFVLENGQICFTDLTVQSQADKCIMEKIKEEKKDKGIYSLEKY